MYIHVCTFCYFFKYETFIAETKYIIVRSACLCVCACGILICIKHSKPSGIDFARISMFYTNLNSADADAKTR